MTFDATFFALVAFLIFFALLIYLKVPAAIAGMLDARAQEIGKELTEARKLREDAEKLLAEYEAKKLAAEAEAREIVEHAKEQAKLVAEETRVSMSAAIARREQQAKDGIAQAEAKAAAEVRAAAAEAALAAAEKLIRERMTDANQSALVSQGVAEMARKFG
jgi:F-type H+-transporting ATPase subunit b